LTLIGRKRRQLLLKLDPSCIAGVVRLPADRKAHSVKQGLCVVWLLNKVHGSAFYRFYRNGNISLARYDDHRPADALCLESAQEFKAGDLRHSHIGDDATGFGSGDGIKENLGGPVGADREISRTQQELKSVARGIVIVDHVDHEIIEHQ
jgi:hypothetical protein